MRNRTKILLLCWILFCAAAVCLDQGERKAEQEAAQTETALSSAAAESGSGADGQPRDTETAAAPEQKGDNGPEGEIAREDLYALSAVLMDGESGRVLYGKEGDVKRPMASTTKVMTCILALENANGNEIVEASARAAGQPDVQLNMVEGEQFYLEDLLYSLMLQSHNDTAVAIAEHIGGSVEEFAEMMNEKARELGCTDTHFVTPNGLDGRDVGGVHSTTARDLARIMRYAVQNEVFRKITQTRTYSFWDLEHRRQFQVSNANAFLDMMEGVVSGKTGFTADAGYCYVCALEREGRTYVVALLGCGWPGNKTYKWSDARRLLEYGLEQYENRRIWQEPRLSPVPVEHSVPPEGNLTGNSTAELVCVHDPKAEEQQVLLRKGEEVRVGYDLPKQLEAPVEKGRTVGSITYYLGDQVLSRYPVQTAESVSRLDFGWCVEQVFRRLCID